MSADDDEIYRTHHDFEAIGAHKRPLSTTLIRALEETGDFDSPSSPVLADIVDPDALDGIFRPVLYRTDRSEGFVEFPIGEHKVRVHADGEIVVRPHEPE